MYRILLSLCRVVSSVIEDTVKNFLFQSSSNPMVANGKLSDSPERNKVGLGARGGGGGGEPLWRQMPTGSCSFSTSPQAPKADVYGLLLPDSIAVSTDKDSRSSKPTSADNTVQLRQPAAAKDVKGGGGVAMRHGKKLRNRRSAVYGGDADEALPKDGEKPASADDMETSPIHNMNVKLVSLSPESSVDRGDESSDALLETRQGKVSDLVKQFEEEEEREGERKAGNLDSVVSSAEGNLTVEGTTEGGREKVKRRKPSNKAFDVFERSGIIMGMVSRHAPSQIAAPIIKAVIGFLSKL